MTDNGLKSSDLENGVDVVDGQFKRTKYTSEFTKSDKVAPNLATYYFRHEDTDSDMDKIEQNCAMSNKTDGQSTMEETSEEEWTYTKTNNIKQLAPEELHVPEEPLIESRIEEVDESQIPKHKAIPEDTIRRLVLKAEELVSPEKCRRNSVNKLTRVNKWLSLDKPDDSCDASGEDDEKESQASEDFDASTMTLREGQSSNSQNTSFDEINSSAGSRAWCGSCISQLDEVSNTTV